MPKFTRFWPQNTFFPSRVALRPDFVSTLQGLASFDFSRYLGKQSNLGPSFWQHLIVKIERPFFSLEIVPYCNYLYGIVEVPIASIWTNPLISSRFAITFAVSPLGTFYDWSSGGVWSGNQCNSRFFVSQEPTREFPGYLALEKSKKNVRCLLQSEDFSRLLRQNLNALSKGYKIPNCP